MSVQSRLQAHRLAELAGGNRRSNRRFAYEAPNAPRTVRDEQGHDLPAQVKDISLRGIGLILEHRPEPSAYLTVELPRKGDLGPLKLVARVANVRRQPPTGWYAGCLFLHDLDDADLLAVL